MEFFVKQHFRISLNNTYAIAYLDASLWLMGYPNPYKMQESWECTFLKVFTHIKSK